MNSESFIVKLQGGLGNQLFQYAFGRALELETGVPCLLDLQEYRDSRRKLGLDHFQSKYTAAPPECRANYRTPRLKLKRQLKQILGIRFAIAATHFIENGHRYDPSVFQKQPPCYFEGYWQSEKYFQKFAPAIRDELRFRDAGLFERHPLYERIRAANSVSVHVRCGDYVKKAKIRKKLHVCTPGYYERAITAMRKRNPAENPHFFVFSDDHDWVRKNLPSGADFTLVSSSTEYEDLFLMSSCKNNIIANSTYSWWAAWLNPNAGKAVIAPDQWFTPAAKLDYKDVAPDGWLKIDCGFGKETLL